MQLTGSSTTFNLGDTSFRRKELLEDYRVILECLQEFRCNVNGWDNQIQALFYEKVMVETNLFSRNQKEDYAKRARTMTNALVKLGLVDSKRNLSKVSTSWLSQNILDLDEVEKLVFRDPINALFARQLLKLRVYSSNREDYFYPFRVAIVLVKMYPLIPEQHFLNIIHRIEPEMDEENILSILRDYKSVIEKTKTYEEYIYDNFENKQQNISNEDMKIIFSDHKTFSKYFSNRKTKKSEEEYFDFVSKLVRFNETKREKEMKDLLKQASKNVIKKAFNYGKKLLNDAKSVDAFLEVNKNNKFLDEDKEQIYKDFLGSKSYDSIREYKDVTKRTFNLTGLFSFNNGLVEFTNKEVIDCIFSDISLSGRGRLTDYEGEVGDFFFQEKTVTEILSICVNEVMSKIKRIFKQEKLSELYSIVSKQKEEEFRNFVKEKFPKQKVVEILKLFTNRDLDNKDEKIKKSVSEDASVPTIYEYIVGLAWFYISDEKIMLSDSFNLVLDGDYLPLSHAGGGKGDIVVENTNNVTMLEVTLMNSNAQKRAEWEPVLRHSVNISANNKNKDVVTLFVADELDFNTINIWRAVYMVPLKSTFNGEIVENVKIFPLKNDELIYLLEKGCDANLLLENISKSYAKNDMSFDYDWRNKILLSAKSS